MTYICNTISTFQTTQMGETGGISLSAGSQWIATVTDRIDVKLPSNMPIIM